MPVPANAASILLAIDVSGSMCSTDVAPNRLTAAQEAAREFIEAQDDGTRIGLVTFSGIAGLLVEPTDRQGGAARGDRHPAHLPRHRDRPGHPHLGRRHRRDQPGRPADRGRGASGERRRSGDYQPDTIVVLTDGRNTQGVDPVTAAAEAAARHLRVYTIGFGTTEPSPMVCTRDQISGDAAFRGDGPGRSAASAAAAGSSRSTRTTLTEVAEMTGGEYFQAEDAEALSDVLLDLPSSIVLQQQDVEITVWFALAGALLVLVAVGLAQWWNRSPG